MSYYIPLACHTLAFLTVWLTVNLGVSQLVIMCGTVLIAFLVTIAETERKGEP